MFKKNKLFFLVCCLILLLAAVFRFYRLGSLTSPYWEEVALAYDSYSLLETGRDHHGNPWPLVAVESFGDFKASFYFYAALPFIRLFGLNVLAIRLPSAIAGLYLVWGTACLAQALAKKWQKNQRQQKLVFLVSLILMAISPWAIQFSRAAWEANLATALLIAAINFFFKYQEEDGKLRPLLLSSLLFVLSAYTYHAHKLIAPLIAISLVLLTYLDKSIRKLFASKKIFNLLLAGLLSLVLFLPLLKHSQTAAGQQRFLETSLVNNQQLIEYSNAKRAAANYSWWSRLYYHRYLLTAKQVALNVFNYFDPQYLFISGDGNLRHHSGVMGQLYYLDAVFLILGLIFLFRQKKLSAVWPVLALLVCLIPEALTIDRHHSLRTLSALPFFSIIISCGFVQVWEFLKKQPKYYLVFLVLAAIVYTGQLAVFTNDYLRSYPQRSAKAWQDSYQTLFTQLNELDDGQKAVYVSREQGRPAMYLWFFSQTDPHLVQAVNFTTAKDQGEFLSYHNWHFFDHSQQVMESAIVAASPALIEQLTGSKQVLGQIYNKQGQLVWAIIDYQLP